MSKFFQSLSKRGLPLLNGNFYFHLQEKVQIFELKSEGTGFGTNGMVRELNFYFLVSRVGIGKGAIS